MPFWWTLKPRAIGARHGGLALWLAAVVIATSFGAMIYIEHG